VDAWWLWNVPVDGLCSTAKDYRTGLTSETDFGLSHQKPWETGCFSFKTQILNFTDRNWLTGQFYIQHSNIKI
jgi:hypothetical protein